MPHFEWLMEVLLECFRRLLLMCGHHFLPCGAGSASVWPCNCTRPVTVAAVYFVRTTRFTNKHRNTGENILNVAHSRAYLMWCETCIIGPRTSNCPFTMAAAWHVSTGYMYLL